MIIRIEFKVHQLVDKNSYELIAQSLTLKGLAKVRTQMVKQLGSEYVKNFKVITGYDAFHREHFGWKGIKKGSR